jgi:glycosyltransferase involved in cell wall biosynthesis
MKTQDGVSIVIPNWNHEVFLPRSVSSGLRGVEALSRIGVPGEVIVVDDYSRDGSAHLLRQLEALYHEQGLRVAAQSANRGLAAARNLGLNESSYRYVVFMDADNEVAGDNLPVFHESLRQTGAAAAYGNLLVRGMTATAAHGVLSNQSFQRGIFKGNYVDAFAMFDRIQVIDAGRYDGSCAAHEDYELWLHLAATGRRVLFVPVTFGYYYENANSMINREQADQNTVVHRRVKRIFDQVGSRWALPLETDCLRYHPDLGYL